MDMQGCRPCGREHEQKIFYKKSKKRANARNFKEFLINRMNFAAVFNRHGKGNRGMVACG